jgi:hypothetical protein
VPARQSNKNLSSRAEPSDSQSESDGGVEGPAVSLHCHQCRRERRRAGDSKQSVIPSAVEGTLCPSISPQPSCRVPHLSAFCAERWEPRISTSARRHPEEAESRTRDSQRRISAPSSANQRRRERPRPCRPEKLGGRGFRGRNGGGWPALVEILEYSNFPLSFF